MTFGYDADRPVLHDLDLEVPAGTTVAVIGRTGSGKTTLDLARAALLRPTGRPCRARRRRRARPAARRSARRDRDRRARTRSSSRPPSRANIAYGAPGATREEVVEAARRAQAHEFIEALPNGYDTLVGERGLTLSGGQRQRLSIARALLVDPRVLILDDATASVDATTEARIREALETVMEGRTTIIVAHRLSTIALADEIVVLENGRVAARGRHDELVDTNPVYAEIWRHGLVDRTFVSLDEDTPAEAVS